MENKADTEALVAASAAGDQAKALGGGDIAVFNAQKEYLEGRRDANVAIAREIRDSELRQAKLYRESGRAGTADRKIKNAERDFLAARKVEFEKYSDGIAAFAVDNGFLGTIDNAQALGIINRKFSQAVQAMRETLNLAIAAGAEFLKTDTGLNASVAEWLLQINATETDTEIVENATVTETVDETAKV